jgi:hypothetical protein
MYAIYKNVSIHELKAYSEHARTVKTRLLFLIPMNSGSSNRNIRNTVKSTKYILIPSLL